MSTRDTLTAPPQDWIQLGSDAELVYWLAAMGSALEVTDLPEDQRKNVETIRGMIELEQMWRRARQIKEALGE